MNDATTRRFFFLMLCAALVLMLSLPVSSAHAQIVLDVNSLSDDPDANPGDKVCQTTAGECTLRAALEEVSAEDIQDRWVIEFDEIPTNLENGRDVARIQTGNELDLQGSRVQIRGDTAPGWQAGDPPIVYVDGSTATGPNTDGLELNVDADTTSIIGLGIVGFPDDGINILGQSSGDTSLYNTIQYCWIGIEPDGSTNGNGFGASSFEQGAGIDVINLRGLTIGAMGNGPISNLSVVYTTGGENVIGGNADMGIYIEVSSTASLNRSRTDVVIANNFIGLLPDGTTPRGNGTYGIKIDDARDNYIGWVSSSGDTFRNYFAGNGDGAIFLNTNDTEVAANYFGITADASSTSSSLAPGQEAILITRPSSFGNNDIGFQSGESRSSGKGNVFGGYDYGIRAGTGNTTDERADNENIRGNYFGVTPGGNSVPLGKAGVYTMFADSLNIRENVFGNIGGGGAEDAAISIPQERIGQHSIVENLIGVLDDGSAQPIDGNGIYMSQLGTSNSRIQDNVIGNATQNGILITNVTDEFRGTIIQRNSIGSTPTGDDIGNGDAGIRFVDAVSGYVGYQFGSNIAADGNLIGFNGGPGVAVTGADSRVQIRGNRFRSNGGPMIDLADDGNTPNDPSNGDADTGPNKLLNTPEVESFDCQPGVTTDNLELTYQVRTTSGNANFDATNGIQVDIYAGSAPDRVDEYLLTENYTSGFTEEQVTISSPNLCDQYLFLTTTDDTAGGSNPEDSSTSEFFNPAPLLPVELASFDVLPTGDRGAELVWETLQEKNNDRFEIEHLAPDASAWANAGTKRGAGTTTERQRYTFTMSDLEVGTHAFRLRQVDVDGTAELLQEKSVEIRLDVAYELRVGPNPMRSTANGVLTLREAQTVRAVVYDVLGREVAVVHDGAMETGKNTFSIDASRLGSGRYFLRVIGESFRDTKPFTVIR